VLDAAVELLTERGLQGTTMSAVIERSGVARATVYLRWPHRQDLIAAAVRRALGSEIIRASGSIGDDLRASGGRFQRALQSATFRSVLPAVVEALSTPADDPTRVSYDTIAPGRTEVAQEYDQLAGSQGFRTDVPGHEAVDRILGALLGVFLGSGRPPSDPVRDRVVEGVIAGLRAPAGRP